jgi:hypothetical protein
LPPLARLLRDVLRGSIRLAERVAVLFYDFQFLAVVLAGFRQFLRVHPRTGNLERGGGPDVGRDHAGGGERFWHALLCMMNVVALVRQLRVDGVICVVQVHQRLVGDISMPRDPNLEPVLTVASLRVVLAVEYGEGLVWVEGYFWSKGCALGIQFFQT